jgi:hypothetical protein
MEKYRQYYHDMVELGEYVQKQFDALPPPVKGKKRQAKDDAFELMMALAGVNVGGGDMGSYLDALIKATTPEERWYPWASIMDDWWKFETSCASLLSIARGMQEAGAMALH